MKKITLMAFALLFITSISNAQIRFGVKAGVNFSNLSTESILIKHVEGATNYQFGVLFQAKAFGFAIQPEILYSVKGGSFDNLGYESIFIGTDNEFKTQNIEVPVNLQFGIDAGFARVFLQGGPYVSFQTGVIFFDRADSYEEFKKYVDNFDYGLGVGAGVELMGIQLALKYDWGLSKLGEEVLFFGNNINNFNDLRYRNLSISLAYIF